MMVIDDDANQPTSRPTTTGGVRVRVIALIVIISLIVVIFCCVEILVRGRLPLLMEEV